MGFDKWLNKRAQFTIVVNYILDYLDFKRQVINEIQLEQYI